jgi:uncharacterized SAM-binding protein YcdF (DUF218 family)
MTASRTRRRTVLVAVVVLIVVSAALSRVAARSIGGWLIVEDAPQQARAIVVLGGELPFRAIEAASLYRDGWAAEVWITQGRRSVEEITLEQLGVTGTSEAQYSTQVLVRKGVPASAVRILPERNRDTADEVRNISKRLSEAGGGRVIVVSSKFHTRRIKFLWRLLAVDRGQIVVRYAREDRFDPDHWWRTTGDAMAVVREYGSMLNAWAGFPISADR